MRLHRQEGPVSQKGSQTNNNIFPVELGDAVPVLAQAPLEDASPGVRPEHAQPGPWLRIIPLPLLDIPHTSPSPPTDLSVESAVYPARTWESAAARKPHTPTLTPTLQKTGDRESSSTEGLGDSTAFPTAALHTSPTDNSVDTPQPTPPTDITGDVRHQSARF